MSHEEGLVVFRRFIGVFTKILHRIRYEVTVAWYKRSLKFFGPGAQIYPGCRITYPQHIHIGGKTTIGPQCFLHAASQGHIYIGERCAIAAFSKFITPTHDPDALPISSIGINKSIMIGDDVWIGTGVIVLPGITIGSRCIIGAGAVVASDLPSDVLAVGVPAKVIRYLLPHEARLENGRIAAKESRINQHKTPL